MEKPIKSEEEIAAVEAMRLELELEQRDFETWLNQKDLDPWEVRHG